MFKFLHAADIHLDSPLLGLDKYEGAPVDAIRGATRKALSNLVNLAIDERVEFVILAGDIYDGDWRDYNTGLFFANELHKLKQADILVFLLHGNHDAESQITSRLTYPGNTRVLRTDRPETIPIDGLHVAIHGQGYARRAETRNLAADFPALLPGCFNIGMLHTALDGREGHEPYAPCSLPQMLAKGYDYWALGHVHSRESVNKAEHVRVEFPGNVQGRHIRETGAKGCLLVSVDDHRRSQTEFQALDVFRWAHTAVDATQAESIGDVTSAALMALADARAEAEGRPLAVRIKLRCAETAYRHIANDLVEFRFDLAAQTDRDVWIEKIKLERVADDHEVASAVAGDADSELRAALAELSADPETARAIFSAGDCGKLEKVLPATIRDSLKKTNTDIFEMAAALLSGGDPGEES